MLKIDFSIDELKYKSVRKSDLDKLESWIKDNVEDDNIDLSLDSQIFYRRFLEYYIADNECFIEIFNNKNLVATFKGRLESNKTNRLIIWFFIMDRSKRNEGLGSKIIKDLLDYFKKLYKISSIEVGVTQDNMEGISFWDSMGFEVNRISTNFFNSGDQKKNNLVIMKKIA